jgi:hypothetical protein
MARRAAGLLSRIDAPGRQRQREGFGFGRLASDLGTIGRASAGDDFLTQLRLRGIRENPWRQAAASVLQNYGGFLADTGFGSDEYRTDRVLRSGGIYDIPAARMDTRGLA